MTAIKHLLDIESLNPNEINFLLDKANQFLFDRKLITQPKPLLKGKTIINLFFENSTRTLYSFEIAEKRLGAHVINFNARYSSVQKGETLEDTVRYLMAMEADCFVVRHPESGATLKIAEVADDQVHIINAGDGMRAHPTQALLDALTIQQHKSQFDKLSVAIIGDIQHSRVARSLTTILKKLGTQHIRVAGPKELLPKQYNVPMLDDINQAIKNVDVIIMLRIQQERLSEDLNINKSDYFQRWGLTTERLKLAKPDAIILHPGPMNREVEIASNVADSPQSVIFQQPKNGVAIRMAVLTSILSS